MLADTDVGSIITAGQSGVAWGYRLLLLQFVLMPILFVVQELTVRLGIHSGKGHGELIRDHFGQGWAWLSAAGLGVATIGAILTELSGVAGVGEVYGVPRWASAGVSALFLLVVVLTGSYRRVERVAIALGRLSGASKPGRNGGGRDPAGFRQRALRLSGRGEYRRRHHALDGVLPAIGGRG
jgi:Mn2+/Fe2+ NRAMP family transporter